MPIFLSFFQESWGHDKNKCYPLWGVGTAERRGLCAWVTLCEAYEEILW